MRLLKIDIIRETLMKQIGLQSSLARSEANDQITTVLGGGKSSEFEQCETSAGNLQAAS